MFTLLRRCLALVIVGAGAGAAWVQAADDVDEAALRKAVTLYASFDEAVRADFGGGELTFSTRSSPEKGKFVFEKGFDDKVFRIAKGKGVSGGALEATDLVPKNGRILLPAKGNIAYKKGGWGGALSVWINTDPNTMFKLGFCDPIQITQKGANNGGIWFDFNDAKPRDMRLGAFPAVPEGQKGIQESDPKAPMVRVKNIGFKSGDWHHIVLSWKNFDTGKKDATAALYIDSKFIGEAKDYAIAMDWDLDKTGIYVAVGYIGLLDELALFNRPLTAAEVGQLHKKPGLLAPLKKEAKGEAEPKRPSAEQRLAQGFRPPAGKPPVPPRFPFDATTARRYQQEYTDWLGLPFEWSNALGMTFVLVPPGTFLMGSPQDEPGRGKDEPQHPVLLTRPFYLAKHETSVGQFRRFFEATRHVTDGEKKGGGHAHDAKAVWEHRPGTSWRRPGFAGPFELKDEHPVVHVSYTDSKEFARWLQQRSGLTSETGWAYDLPTEAQWEWSCRAGSASRFSWGPDEDTTGKLANVGDRALKKVHPDWPRTIMAMDDGHAFLAPVGSYRPNGFGLHDMLGNVWEFCSTRSGPYPTGPVTDPGDLDPKRGFAVRGGGWSNMAKDARCATRNADPPHFCHSNLGFRMALAIPPRPAGK